MASKPIVGYRTCEYCSVEMPIRKYYEKKRFCSASCRSKVITMPPTPDRTGATPWNKGLTKNDNDKIWEMSISRTGELNWMWQGDGVSYSQLHKYMKARIKKPEFCEICGKAKAVHLSNISYEYTRQLEDWEYLCAPCHFKKDYANGWGKATERFGL